MSLPASHPFPFDPTHGFSLHELEAVRPDPPAPGFDDFWRRRYARARQIDPEPATREIASPEARWRAYEIDYVSTDSLPIGGWLLIPSAGEIARGLVVGHGYGGREAPEFDLLLENTAVLFPCCRGLSRSRRPPISEDPAWHVLHDIEDPDRYILGGCVEDLWVAVSALQNLFPQVGDRIGYSGLSFGGGLGALALAFDPRLDRGCLVVPTFGKMSLWLNLPSVGSAASVQQFRKRRGGVEARLALFDSATAASRITAPMLTAVALFDPAVAPPCQFAVVNALTTSKLHERVILDAGHFDYPGEREQQALFRERFQRFFGAA